MTLLLDAPPDLLGAQEPRISAVPEYNSTTGDEAIELAALAGLELDPWQQWCLRHSLGERDDGQWAAFSVGLMVSRQNGKGSILEARELAALFLLAEPLIIHTAHEQATASEHFRRLWMRIDGTPELKRRVLKPTRGKGSEAIEMRNGQRIFFKTRTSGGGLGFTADLLVLDEAMVVPDSFIGVTLPTLSSRPNPQVWYTGSAVDQDIHPDGVVFARVRERAIQGDDDDLFYAEWSAAESLAEVTESLATDPEAWARANPALGARIRTEYISKERKEFASNLRGFAVQRLGIGDWPRTDVAQDRFIEPEAWDACCDPDSVPASDPFYAFDVQPDRSWATICSSSKREDETYHVEVVAHERGTSWLAARVQEILAEGASVYCDAYGAAKTVLPEMERRGIPVTCLSAGDITEACGLFYDSVVETSSLRHLNDEVLNTAVAGACTRAVGGAWAWNRKDPTVDISPLVAVTVALWAAHTQETGAPNVWDLNEIVAEIKARKAQEGGA